MNIAFAPRFFGALFIVFSFFVCVFSAEGKPEDKKLLIYNWEDYLPQDVLDEFERETGIHVIYDVFDSNETLEARLLSGPSGYDVVFPSSSPFFSRQLAAGAFLKLDHRKIPNITNINKKLLELLQTVDPENLHGLPYVWGTSGFAFNVNRVQLLMPSAPKDSLAMLLDPKVVSRFKSCGVSFMETPTDLFDMALLYLGLVPSKSTLEDIDRAAEILMKVRPFISKFATSQVATDLANGDICLAQCMSLEAFMAQQRAQEARQPFSIEYVIPKEGGEVWCDMMAIPRDAPHPDNAHLFMNFLLQPKVMARITNATFAANPVEASKPWVNEEIRNSNTIFPDLDALPKIYMQRYAPRKLERYRLKLWLQIKTNH